MSVEEFQAHWRGSHPAVVVRLPGIRRYVQSHMRLAGYRKGEPVYDAIPFWFEDGKAMHALRQPTVRGSRPRAAGSSTAPRRA